MGFTRAVCVAAATGAFLLAGPVSSAEVSELGTGNGVYALCTSSRSGDAIACMSFLEGFVRGAGASSMESKTAHHFCIPETATVGQLRDYVVSELRKFPQIRHLDSRALLMVALMRGFPCASK